MSQLWKGTGNFCASAGKIFQTNVLPFGLASAPRAFTEILIGLGAKWRLQGAWVIIYLDDIFISGDTFESWKKAVKLVYEDLSEAGLRVNVKKLFVGPFQKIEFLGAVLDHENQVITVSDKKVAKAMKMISEFKEEPRSIEKLERFLGFLSFLSIGVRGTRLFRRAMDRCLADLKAGRETATQEAIAEATFWERNLVQLRGRKSTKEVVASETIYTDASGVGWGAAVVERGKVQRVGLGELTAREQGQSSTARELIAVLRALEKAELEKKTVIMFSDNTGTVASMGGMMARAEDSIAVMKKIAIILQEKELEILPIHCGREYGFIPLCDKMSKDGVIPPQARSWVPGPGGTGLFPPRDQMEWEIGHTIFNANIRPLLSTNFIDVFATPRNKKNFRFCSRVDCFESLGNGLALDWNGEEVYAFPPFSLLELVLQKLAHSKPKKCILITKDISTTPMWTVARRLVKNPPQILKKEKGLLYLDGMPGDALFDLFVWSFL